VKRPRISTKLETWPSPLGDKIQVMVHEPDIAATIATTAALFGDPVRAAFLIALLDRAPLSAG